MSVGRKLTKWRKRAKLSQGDAAGRIGATQASWCEWETDRKRPNAHQRDAIAVLTSGKVPADAWQTRAERRAVAKVKPFNPETVST